MRMDDLEWTKDFNLTIVLANEEVCRDQTCLKAHINQLQSHILPAIRVDLDGVLMYASSVRIAYGFVGIAELAKFVPEICDTIRAVVDLTIAVTCMGHEVEANDQYQDIREIVAQAAHADDWTDFYLFMDNNVRGHSPMWIADALLPLLRETFIGSLGLSVSGCSLAQALMNQQHIAKHFASLHLDHNDQVEYDASMLLDYPVNPVLHRSHFDLIRGKRLFLMSAHYSLNNFLLHDVYRSINSVFCVDYRSKLQQVEDQHYLLIHYNEWMDQYVEHLPLARDAFLSVVNTMFSTNPLVWQDAQLRLQPGDTLYWYYCSNWLDSCGPAAAEAEIGWSGDAATDSRPGMTSNWLYQRKDIVNQTQVMSVIGLEQLPSELPSAVNALLAVSLGRDAVIVHPISLFAATAARPRVAVITVSYGAYEASCKAFARQTIPTDFYCFTDNENVINGNNGWIVDTTPYHLSLLALEQKLNLTNQVNSLHNNQHPFNIAKYYKLHFKSIPCLQAYDKIIWVDGSVRVADMRMTERIVGLMDTVPTQVIAFEQGRHGLEEELQLSLLGDKYVTEHWGGFDQSYQNVTDQVAHYVQDLGYNDAYWIALQPHREHFGVWCTCFAAFNMCAPEVGAFLDLWQQHVRNFTTQDQLSFSMVAQQLHVHPFTLPNGDINGGYDANTLYNKLGHHT